MKTRITTAIAMLALSSGAILVACSSDPDAPNETSGSAGSGTGGAGTGGDQSSSTTNGGAGGTSSSASGGGAPSFEGFTQVDQSGAAQSGSASIAIAPDGTIYVSWVSGPEDGDDVLVARSTDGGQTFGAPVTVDDGSVNPLVTNARSPWIAADDQRVAVAIGDPDGDVHLYVADADTALAFDDYNAIGTEITTPFRDFAKPVFLPDGTLAVAYHAYPTSGARVFLARESNGYTSESATSGSPGEPCECCPIELLVDAEGDLMTAYRNNDGNLREFWVAQAPSSGTFSSFAQASTTEGTINQCPMQGPRMAQLSPTDHVMVYSSRGQGNPGAVMLSFSSDDGASWSGGTPIAGLSGDEPTIMRGPSGRLYVTAVTGNGRSAMIQSDDDGQSWSASQLIQSDDGDIAVPQPSGGGSMAAIAGVSDGNNVWFLRME